MSDATSESNKLHSLCQALQNPDLYDHPIEHFELIETHISLVLLTGEVVYKIKKPVDFGFLDFSTLEKRHHYCEEEWRLNRRLAPQLYLGVVAITGSHEQPQLNGSGQVIEYAVKMRQFPQATQLDRLLEAGRFEASMMERLADKVAGFHLSIAAADASSPYGDYAHVSEPMQENFTHIRDQLSTTQDEAPIDQQLTPQLDRLEQWTTQQLAALAPLIRARKENGFVRECHGDMHLRNIALWQEEIIVFDCIEFNPNLYWLDVISDIAFLVMDLEARKQAGLAQRFLNRYLEITGDYAGLQLMVLYKVYRAMVRAKVSALRLQQEQSQKEVGSDEYQQTLSELRQYLALAESYTQPHSPILLINVGLSGSGKSFLSRQLAERLPAILLRSDVERKRLYQVLDNAKADAVAKEVLYAKEATDKTYAHLLELARVLLAAGYTVIIDAANLKQSSRQMFIDLGLQMQLPTLILAYQADEAILRQRITQRVQEGEDVSDATVTVLEQQLASAEPLTEAEQEHSLIIDTDAQVDVEALATEITRFKALK